MSIRFRIHASGEATLAGVEQHDLRSILDGASIHYYDDLAKLRAKKRLTANDRETIAWLEHMVKTLNALQKATDAGIRSTFPTRPERAPTKAERLAIVKAERYERELIERCLSRLTDSCV